MIKLKKLVKQLLVYIKSIFSKPLGTGCDREDADNYDRRDFIASNIFGTPTDEELNNVKTIVSLTHNLVETYNQGCVPSCTAVALSHNVLLQNIIEHSTTNIFVDPKYQRENNQGKVWSCSHKGGDYLKNALSTAHANGIVGTIDSIGFTFNIDGYAFDRADGEFSKSIKTMLYYLNKGHPLYCAIMGNAITQRQMLAGEMTSYYTLGSTTRGHAIILTAINLQEGYVEFVNSWTKNNGNLCTFRMSIKLFERLINNKVFNWRYWITHDTIDTADHLFADFKGEKGTEEYDAVKRVKTKGYIKGVGNNRLEPNRAITRLEAILLQYRIMKRLELLEQGID